MLMAPQLHRGLSAAGSALQPHLLAERLLQQRHPVGPLAPADEALACHGGEFEAHHPPAARRQPRGDGRSTKTCACCGRPFQWRRKWKDVWEEVRYCSERCRNQARRPAQRQQRDPAAGS